MVPQKVLREFKGGTVNLVKLINRSWEFIELLDEVNLNILEAMERHGPRNIMKISEVTGIPKSTVYLRVQRMKNIGLTFEPSIACSKLGLGIMYAIVEPYPGRLEIAYNALDLEWTFRLAVTNTPRPMIYMKAYYPYPHHDLLVKYLKRLRTLRVINDYKVLYVGDEVRMPKVRREYFDLELKQVILPWDKWFSRLLELLRTRKLRNGRELKSIEDPVKYDIVVDEYDIKILDMLYEDASMKFTNMAKKLDISPPVVRHHYVKHIVQRGVIVNFMPRFLMFHPALSMHVVAHISFTDEFYMRAFLNALWDAPITIRVSKVIGDATLVMTFDVPREHERYLLRFLDYLTSIDVVHRYELYPIIPGTISAWTLPVNNFKDGRWMLGYDEMLNKLKSVKRKLEEVKAWVITRPP